MGLLAFEDEIIGSKENVLKEGEKITTRRQQCRGCHNVLALQIATNLDKQSEADYYVVRDCIWLKGEPHLLYDKVCWFGNFAKCPVCGRKGKLPMDIPLNWELMQKTKEVKNVAV